MVDKENLEHRSSEITTKRSESVSRIAGEDQRAMQAISPHEMNPSTRVL